MLKVENLTFSHKGTPILNGVSYSVARAETVGIIGPNGSGKTSMFNCLSGFYRPSGGVITFKNHDITFAAPHLRARLGLGRVFQSVGVFHEMTVLENMLIAIESRQRLRMTFFPWTGRHRENRARALSLLAEVKLADKAHECASSLSGGQLRLLEIMRAFAYESELFLLDEPTAGVSPRLKDTIVASILKLQAAQKTVLVIEHDLGFIQQFCKRIVVLDLGKVILDDTPERVRANPALQEIYFGGASSGAMKTNLETTC